MLVHQLPQLLPLEAFWEALPTFFRWLEGGQERVRVVPPPLAVGQAVLRGPAGGLGIPYRASAHMEVVRFAASNRLCVELSYEDDKGNRTQRTIEPYSLRSTIDGNYVLGSYDRTRDDWRSFRLDRIRSVQVSSQSFEPRYEIELTPTAVLWASPVPRSAPAARSRTIIAERRSARPHGLRVPSTSTDAHTARRRLRERSWMADSTRIRTSIAIPVVGGPACMWIVGGPACM